MASLNESPSLPRSWRCCVALLLSLSLLMVGSTQASMEITNSSTTNETPGAGGQYRQAHARSFDSILPGQIAAHHPALKDHIITRRPSVLPNSHPSLSARSHPQLFAREHGGCPDGYIPVQRKDPNRPSLRKERPPQAPGLAPTDGPVHEYAVTMPVSNGAYSGSAVVLSVNVPTVANTSELILSQLWIIDGSYDDKSVCTIEVGWLTFKCSTTPLVWWLFLYGVAIGCWPAALYPSTYLQGTANFLDWGGETVMGSGEFPAAGFPLSAYQRNITYGDVVSGVTNMDANVTYLTGLIFRTDPNCYDKAIQLSYYVNWGTYFFFGGPGGNNASCKGTP
uniref:Neprosin PEP catalytic domain-containing protein n=1 Tax=Physcomitrium patens TaxID=3218 RepID=A0A7I4BN97_PHYPA